MIIGLEEYIWSIHTIIDSTINFNNKKMSGITYNFPKVNRVFPTLFAQSIIGVQPLAIPTGTIFHLNYVFGSNGVIIPIIKKNHHENLIEDILKNWENIEAVLYDIPVITLKSVPINIQSRKLKAKWVGLPVNNLATFGVD